MALLYVIFNASGFQSRIPPEICCHLYGSSKLNILNLIPSNTKRTAMLKNNISLQLKFELYLLKDSATHSYPYHFTKLLYYATFPVLF